MRGLILLLAAALICCTPAVFAQDDKQDHSAHQPAPEKDAEAPPPAEHDHGAAKPDALQENMQSIESLMRQIQQADDAGRKHELLGQHLQALRQQMRLIVSQRASTKTDTKEGAKTDAGAPAGKEKAGAPEGKEKEGGMMKGEGMMKGGGMMMHKKVEQRLDMLERVLRQVIEREAVEADPARH